ncbi:hypothetical protein AB205_0055210, partial [Aquarana catesbeiana]
MTERSQMSTKQGKGGHQEFTALLSSHQCSIRGEESLTVPISEFFYIYQCPTVSSVSQQRHLCHNSVTSVPSVPPLCHQSHTSDTTVHTSATCAHQRHLCPSAPLQCRISAACAHQCHYSAHQCHLCPSVPPVPLQCHLCHCSATCATAVPHQCRLCHCSATSVPSEPHQSHYSAHQCHSSATSVPPVPINATCAHQCHLCPSVLICTTSTSPATNL